MVFSPRHHLPWDDSPSTGKITISTLYTAAPCWFPPHVDGSLHGKILNCLMLKSAFFAVWNLCIVLVLVIIIYDYYIMLLHTALYLSHDWLYIDSHPLSWHPKAMNACSKAHRWSLALWLFGESLRSGGRSPGYSQGCCGQEKLGDLGATTDDFFGDVWWFLEDRAI